LSEIESTFVVLSRDYNRVYDLISECIFNKGYGIEKNEIQISDAYFDSKDEILKNKDIALRIRTINGKITKITLKIPRNVTENYSERVELEEDWSKESLNQTLSRLNSYLYPDINNTSFKFDEDPKISLLNLGFKIIQNRETTRIVINAVDKKTKGTAFEFAFDTTTYIFDSDVIRIMELEIESKKHGNSLKLNNFVNNLKVNQSLLKIWPYSKLLTGKAIEILLNNKKLKEMQDYDDENILTLPGLKKVESFIK
jgi:inorganic triphosphatase YgiF